MKITIIALITVGVIATGALLLIGSRSQQVEENSVALEKEERVVKTVSRFNFLVDPAISYQEKAEKLRSSRHRLSGEDVEYLYTLYDHNPEERNQDEWWAVLNEVMDTLRHVAEREEYTLRMLELINSEELHEVVRDYAIQHLGLACFPEENEVPLEVAVVDSILQNFVDIILDRDNSHTSLPGTTLNILGHMNEGNSHSELLPPYIKDLEPWLSQSLTDEHSLSLPTRVDAINSIGNFQLTNLTPAVRSLATDPQQNPTVRLNALAALGSLGDSQDILTLSEIAESPSKFRFAAQAALKKISTN